MTKLVQRIWGFDLPFMASMNIAMGLLMIFMPAHRTSADLYRPARMLLEWAPIYPFVIYGAISLILGMVLLVASYRPMILTIALALGAGYWMFWTLLYLLGVLFGGDTGGLGIIACLALSQLRRHLFLFPSRQSRHE